MKPTGMEENDRGRSERRPGAREVGGQMVRLRREQRGGDRRDGEVDFFHHIHPP